MLTANEIYQRLIEREITKNTGEIQFNFLDVSVQIKEKSAIGDLFQEWFANWMKSEGIAYRTPNNTQEFPDFLLHPISNKSNLLEVKTFNFGIPGKQQSPGFDVANFEAYCYSLKTKSYRLDADYLICGYSLINGIFKVEKLWLKKAWEITGKAIKYPITVQAKEYDGNIKIDNIRPFTWYSQKARTKPFQSRLDFVKSLYATLMQYQKTKPFSQNWFIEVSNNYFYHTKQKL